MVSGTINGLFVLMPSRMIKFKVMKGQSR